MKHLPVRGSLFVLLIGCGLISLFFTSQPLALSAALAPMALLDNSQQVAPETANAVGASTRSIDDFKDTVTDVTRFVEGVGATPTYDLTNTCPNGVGDVNALINAIGALNPGPVLPPIAGSIVLAPNCLYTLTAINNSVDGGPTGLPKINQSVLIIGNGAIIERSATAGIPAFRLWLVERQGDLTLQNVTLRNGNADNYSGGALANLGSVTIENSAVVSNTNTSSDAAIVNVGSMAITNSTVSYNTANCVSGIFNNGGDVTLTNSTFSHNTSGGCSLKTVIYSAGNITLTQSAITNNQSSGLVSSGNDRAVIRNSTLSGNEQVGLDTNSSTVTVADSIITNNGLGIHNGGIMTVTNSLIMSNTNFNNPTMGNYHGGGISIDGGQTFIQNSTISHNRAGYYAGISHSYVGALTLINSTVSDNVATWNGGGIGHGGPGLLTIINSTISGNRANGTDSLGIGGGLLSYANVIVRNSTFVNNTAGSGGGIYQDSGSGGVVTLMNSIVAAQGGGGDCVGIVTASSFNLDSDGSCGEALTANPLLNTLQVNAPGSTATHALQLGSPAIDAGDTATCLTTDQRGVNRPIDGNGDRVAACDLGAYEAPAATFATITIIHDAVPNSATNFRFTSRVGSFYLDDIPPPDADAYSNQKRLVVAPGAYNVTEVVPSTWVLAGIVCNPATKGTVNLSLKRVTLRVVAGDNVTCTFTNQSKASFNALIFHDLNQNRVYNTGEPGLPGWLVRIYDLNNIQLLAGTTDAVGKANFPRQLPPNTTYKVCVDVASGWMRTVPTTLDPVLGKPCYTRTPTPGQTLTLRFGNKPLAVGAAAEEEVTEIVEDVMVEEAPELAPDESGYDAGYVEEEEGALPSTRALFLPLIRNTR